MKDEYLGVIRIVFAVAAVCAVGAYAYFLYPSLKNGFSAASLEYLALENEKTAIGEIMIYPERAGENISDAEARLAAIREVGDLTAETAADDIMRSVRLLGIELDTIVIGTSSLLRQDAGGEESLFSLPMTIRCKSSYDAGMYLIAEMENSDRGSYVIDDFSFTPPEGEESSDFMIWAISVRLIYHGEI